MKTSDRMRRMREDPYRVRELERAKMWYRVNAILIPMWIAIGGLLVLLVTGFCPRVN